MNKVQDRELPKTIRLPRLSRLPMFLRLSRLPRSSRQAATKGTNLIKVKQTTGCNLVIFRNSSKLHTICMAYAYASNEIFTFQLYAALFFNIVSSLAICRDPPGGAPEKSDPFSEPTTPGNETYQKLAKSENFLFNQIFK